ncbi:unnamed protein product [Nezara viridula]|uniref:Neuropeptide n=1 Tax=Nezara viridula TaxID=85310 RepID=A0A9P0HFU8_NEZVI|nr:unnamed protein product [Nezara viridula]
MLMACVLLGFGLLSSVYSSAIGKSNVGSEVGAGTIAKLSIWEVNCFKGNRCCQLNQECADNGTKCCHKISKECNDSEPCLE